MAETTKLSLADAVKAFLEAEGYVTPEEAEAADGVLLKHLQAVWDAMPTERDGDAWHGLNLNDFVRVKLTDKGLERFAQHRQRLNEVLVELNATTKPYPLLPNLDADGFWRTQLWSLMQNYGDLCGPLAVRLPFDTEMETRRG